MVAFYVPITLGVPKLPTISWNSHQSSTASSSSYSFSSIGIGAASPTRYVIVGVQLSNSFPNNGPPDSVTIGGVSATQVATQNTWALNNNSFWIASVPTGTTATIVINISSGGTGVRLECWSAYDLFSASAVGTLAINGANPASGSLTTSVNGIAVAISSRDTAQTTTWSGVNSDDSGFTVSGVSLSGGSVAGISGTTLTVTATPSAGTSYMLAASFR